MSTAVAAGVRPAHGGFQRSGSGKPDPEDADRMRDANGYLVKEHEEEEEEEERGGEAAAAGREEEALSDASSIGAASSDSSSIGENSASDKEGSDGEEEEEVVEGKAQGLGMMGLATLQSLDDALPTK
jgi:hypothetical protein